MLISSCLKNRVVWRSFLGPLLSLMLVMHLSGCGIYSTLSASNKMTSEALERTGTETMVSMPSPQFGEATATQGAREFALMALLSSVSYAKHLAPKDRSDCLKTTATNPMAIIDPPRNGLANWRRWENVNLACFSDIGSGLYYEVYVYGKPLEVDAAVIAIRGTENSRFQLLKDWWNDLAVAVLAIDPAQYKLAREKIGETVTALRGLNPKNAGMRIQLTGHSLGGGLAQQSAYMEANTEAIVFNTSPVTNWSNLVHQGLIQKEIRDPKIIRITENGEGLSYVRWLTSRVNTRRFNRSDVEFYFSKGMKNHNPIAAHSMDSLTCNFAKRVTGDTAAFHFTEEMAKQVLKNAMCDGYRD